VRLDLDVILPSLIAAGLILLISLPVHECAHALTAYRLGDSTAKLFGRLTLNPIVHFDPVGGTLLIISSLIGFGIGWAKPTPVNPINLRGGAPERGTRGGGRAAVEPAAGRRRRRPVPPTVGLPSEAVRTSRRS
jgi:Zn-dependent protease